MLNDCWHLFYKAPVFFRMCTSVSRLHLHRGVTDQSYSLASLGRWRHQSLEMPNGMANTKKRHQHEVGRLSLTSKKTRMVTTPGYERLSMTHLAILTRNRNVTDRQTETCNNNILLCIAEYSRTCDKNHKPYTVTAINRRQVLAGFI